MTEDEADLRDAIEPHVGFVYPGEPDPEVERRQHVVMHAAFCFRAGFLLGQWSAGCPVRSYAASVVLRQTGVKTGTAARRLGRSSSYVRRMIRQARAVASSARETREGA